MKKTLLLLTLAGSLSLSACGWPAVRPQPDVKPPLHTGAIYDHCGDQIIDGVMKNAPLADCPAKP
jgi:hypothetical protein